MPYQKKVEILKALNGTKISTGANISSAEGVSLRLARLRVQSKGVVWGQVFVNEKVASWSPSAMADRLTNLLEQNINAKAIMITPKKILLT